jgi:glycosyltransferase involved in cell wall biosynthesis
VQTQVIPYLREIIKDGVEISLLTFEPEFRKKWTAADIEEQRAALAEIGIKWHALPYHKRPSAPATAWDIFAGVRYVRKLMKREKFDILHARVHIPALMGALAREFSSHKPKLLFDIRGFFPEEYTDAGIWPEDGLLYRSAKRVERWIMERSDGFVLLTEKARSILFPESVGTGFDKFGRPVEVIPCCVDLPKRFPPELIASRERSRQELGVADRRVFTHLGALGGLYLTKEIVDLLAEARNVDPSVFALFITQSDPQRVITMLEERGFSDADYFVDRVPPDRVGYYLIAADVGLSIVMATFATASRSPTKIPEYLAAGLPIIANKGVGDVDTLLADNGIGVRLDGFALDDYRNALDELNDLGSVSEKCRATAASGFGLESIGGPRYRRLYRRLFGRRV